MTTTNDAKLFCGGVAMATISLERLADALDLPASATIEAVIVRPERRAVSLWIRDPSIGGQPDGAELDQLHAEAVPATSSNMALEWPELQWTSSDE